MMNMEEILDRIEKDYEYLDRYVRNEDLLNNKEFMLEVLKTNPYCYRCKKFEKFRSDIDVLKYLINDMEELVFNNKIHMSANYFDGKMLESNEEYKELYNKFQQLRLKYNYLRLFYVIVPSELSKQIEFGNFDPKLINDEFVSKINDLVSTLAERYQKIIRLRLVLHDGKNMSLDELSQIIGVTKERIRQLESVAYRRLGKELLSTELGCNVIDEAVKCGILNNDSQSLLKNNKTDDNGNTNSLK